MADNRKQNTTSTNQLTAQGGRTINNVLSSANDLYDNNVGGVPYSGNTVSPFSKQQTRGFDSMMKTAGSYNGYMAPAMRNIQGMAAGGSNPLLGQMAAGNERNANNNFALNHIASGAARGTNNNPFLDRFATGENAGANNNVFLDSFANGSRIGANDNPFINSIALGQRMGKSSNPLFRRYAAGEFLNGRLNPTFSAVVDRTQQDAHDAVNMNAAAAGRYGSGVHQGNVAREIAGVTNRMLSDQYNREVGNMFTANQHEMAGRQQDYGNLFGAQNIRAGNYQRNFNNAMSAQGRKDQNRYQDFNAAMAAQNRQTGDSQRDFNNMLAAQGARQGNYNQNFQNVMAAQQGLNAGQSGAINAANALPGMYNASLYPAQTMTSVGQRYQDLNQGILNQRRDQFNAANAAPWNQLARLISAASGNATAGATTQSQSGTSGMNWGQLIGNAAQTGAYLL
ncbi:MAG: hypothetical protein GY943_30605 [Chloroflexi bacterium]|nr:hypothetical protein [Chloroflexota bacterium]